MDAQAQAFFQDRRVVVIGAGYVGGQVADACLKAGAEVAILTRNKAVCEGFAHPRGKALCCDIAGNAWHEALRGRVDFCLVCMGAGGGGLEGYFQSYVLGMNSIRDWVKTADVHTITYTGSTSVYPQEKGLKVSEDADLQASSATGPRSHLLAAEETFRDAGRGAQRSAILRLGGIYGPGRHFYLDQLRQGVTTFAGAAGHHLNLVHRDDIVGAILALWRSRIADPFLLLNLVDDGRATRRELVEWLARRIGLADRSFSFDAAAGRTRADRIILNNRIKAQLGWTPRYPSFRAGYEAILA